MYRFCVAQLGGYRICKALAVDFAGRPHLCGAAPMPTWIWGVHRKCRPHLFSTPPDDPDLCGACRDDARIYVVRA